MLTLKRLVIFIFLLFLLSPSQAGAWDDKKTHPALTLQAIKNTKDVKDALKSQLGFEKNFDEKFYNGKENHSITKWLKEGSRKEDEPLCRAANHFHNPWKPWDQSMLTDPHWFADFYCDNLTNSPFFPKYSNISWATGVEKETGEPMPSDVNGLATPQEDEGRNWLVARDKYYWALVAPDPQVREARFAETFQTLGYIVHLLEDMAVPAHTRNDFSQGHSQYIGCPDDEWWCYIEIFLGKMPWKGNPFEGYVRNHFYDQIYPKICGDEKCDISKPFIGEKKLTNFWDTDTNKPDTLLEDINFTGQNIGLAEYSNINFVSFATIPYDDIAPVLQFDYPSKESIVDQDYPEKLDADLYQILAKDGKFDKGVYIAKHGEGEDIKKFLKVRYIKAVHLDINGQDYLVELIDYKRDLTLDDPCYLEYASKLLPRAIGYSASLIDYFFRGRLDVEFVNGGITVVNRSEETMENGVFKLFYDTPEGVRTLLLMENITADGLAPGASQTFNVTIPESAQLILVYRGDLGLEKDAVVGRVLNTNSRIAYFNRQDDGSGFTSNIYTVSPKGTLENPYRADVTDSTGTGMGTEENPLHFSPAWSGDGTKMAFETMFCSDYNTDLSCSSQNVVRNISVIDPYSEQRFPNNRVRADLTYENAWVSNSSFSPDGTRIAALMQKNNVMSTWLWGGLVVFNLEDGSSTLVNDYDNLLYTSLWGGSPVWSPDGEQILYSVYQQYDAVTHDLEREGDLLLVNLTTKAITELTNDIYFDTQPSWSPDGEWIVFSSNRAGKGFMDIFLIDKNGDNPPSLLLDCAQYEFDCFNPVFSPSGLQVAFSNGSYIHTISSDGDLSSLKPIVGPGIIGGLDWSPVISPPSITAQASPYVIDETDQTTLTWESSGAVEVRISGIPDEQPAAGSFVVSPQETTNYTLTAVGAAGVKTTTVTVTVVPMEND